ncbi:MAG: calcium/sodium antiporter [Gammaproteobacteria bacterium]|nr:MAG: calcium/sodium antiporter [Gammaproteobacteria bacterium]
MIEPHPFIVFAGGVAIVLLGADLLLRGAARIAAMLGIPPIVIGLTVVSIGTSTPELAVGITAALDGRGPLAIGNIAGTNLLNILFILGLSAAIRPLPIRLQSIQLDVPTMIGSAIALIVFSLDRVLSPWEGVLFVLAAALYTVALVRGSRRESPATKQEFAHEFGAESARANQRHAQILRHSALLLAGIALTVLGANLLVTGAVDIARAFGVSDAFIGLTIVAVGTSAPELATTIIATWRNDRDVAIGNLIGSSIYNILVILGLTMLVAPGGIEVGSDALWIDLPLMTIVAVLCLPVFRSGQIVSRTEGILGVGIYLAYLVALIALRT